MFYAISAMGWGRGDTPDKAESEYRKALKRDYPHLTEEDIQEAWGFVWEAPEGATGFYSDNAVHWTFDDPEGRRESIDAEASQRVQNLGYVPERWSLKEYVVTVSGVDWEQADWVIARRIQFDEDYGFEYSINWRRLS